jgi:photosystem II stability/assembly factor-like uncharacterized protein
MHFLPLTFYLLSFFSVAPGLQTPMSRPAKISQSITRDSSRTDNKPKNVFLQSNDGGETWQDISQDLPDKEGPQEFFAGTSVLYIRVMDKTFRSKADLKTPVWIQDDSIDPIFTSIAFTRSGMVAFNTAGLISQLTSSVGSWSPAYTTFKKPTVETVYETSDGAVFVGTRDGLYKSADKGRTWKQVVNNGWVMELVESGGVLIGTSEKGIMRSTDNGEHWEWVISEGGVGIDVEAIDGGFAVISYSGSTMSRRVRLSLDKGKTWSAIDEGLRPALTTSSIKQVGKHLICAHPDGIFRSSDLGKTWNLVHDGGFRLAGIEQFKSSDARVFQLYVSGNVLYAVLKNSGC